MKRLQQKNQWVNWIAFNDPCDNKIKKIPKNPKNGYPAKVNDPSTWGSFALASSKVNNTITHRYYPEGSGGKFQEFDCDIAGIGFIFADGICGIDLDNKGNDPLFEERAQNIIRLMNTYTEYSPSGKGYHLIFQCDMSKIPAVQSEKSLKLDTVYYQKNPKLDVECYFSGLTNRFFTYTGEAINGLDIEERTEQVLIFLEKYMLRENFEQKNSRQEQTESAHKDKDILETVRNAKNSAKFSTLFDRGDISAYNNDDSSADMALCSMLAFYCQGDFNQIDYYFRQSALYRSKWERQDYRINTINKAIAGCGGKFYKPPGRPKSKDKGRRSKEGTQTGWQADILTIAAVKNFLEQLEISLKYNEITRKTEIRGFNDYNNNYIVDSLPVIIYDMLNLRYKKCPKSDVQDFLKVIMMNNAYNPVLEMIESGIWDGIDRLPELFGIMKIADTDRLSKTLIYKWLWQNLSMLHNKRGDFGADGLLVLKGGQAVGKTTFARKMSLKNEFFGEGLLLDVRDKDSIIRAVSCWIGELGEIESTFKSDINALKAFITLPADKYRVPYGRTAEDLPRRTSFIGTCNSDKYLIDETGNRRYWTVSVNERMDLDALEKFDALQLYLQIYEKAKNNIQGFRLTQDEQTALASRNTIHEKPLKAEFEIRDILEVAERDNLRFEEMTITEFKELYPVLARYEANVIGKALNKAGIEHEVKKKDGKTRRLAKLPRPKYKI